MKVKTEKLKDGLLDWAVSLITNPDWSEEDRRSNTVDFVDTGDVEDAPYDPSSNWAIAGPILSGAGISRTTDHSGLWIAYWTDGYESGDDAKKVMHCNSSELVAGLRCFVGRHLGDEVNVPVGLLK